jgi:hypothetical protein
MSEDLRVIAGDQAPPGMFALLADDYAAVCDHQGRVLAQARRLPDGSWLAEQMTTGWEERA